MKSVIICGLAWGLLGVSVAGLDAQDVPALPAATQPMGLFDTPSEPPASTQSATQPTTQSVAQEPPMPPSVILPDGKLMLNFRNASLDSVLTFLSEATGLVVVGDTRVEGKVSVMSRQPVTLDEAMGVLSSLLKDKGYTAVRTGKTLRIVTLDAAKKANIPVYTGSNPKVVIASDELITQVIPIRVADATQLKRDLAPLVPAYADLSSNASTNTLILTDTAANVKRLMEVVSALDTAMSAVTQVQVFPLKYANAANAARLVGEVFRQDQTTSTGRPGTAAMPAFGRFFGPGGMASPASTGSSDPARPQVKVTASSDDRTNTVVVSAPVDLMPMIVQVLKELDANPAQDQAVFIYPLRNATATNVEAVVNSLFGTSGSTGTRSTGTTTNRTTTGTTRTPGTSSSSNSNMNLSQIGSGSRTTGGIGTTNRNTGTVTGSMPRLSSSAAQTAADLAGQVYAVADASTNSLLVMTGSGNFDKVKSILAELDRAVPQVLIKVLLAEVTHDNDRDLGVEFSAINLKTSGSTTVFTDFGVASATGGLITKFVDTDVTVALRALEKVGKLDVLSRPYILTSDNQLASIIVGQRVPFITNTRTTDTGQTINTIQYEDIGIILNVTPHINPDGLVIMDVTPEISSQTGTTVPISETVNAPVFAKRSANTRIAINDGKTIVIGGLMEDRKTETVNKVPLLGDIPLLGQLFQRNQTVKAKTELLIFLTPHVAKEPGKLVPMSEDEQKGAVIVPKAVDEGVFQQHMEGLQRGSSRNAETQPAVTPAATSQP